MKVDFSQDRVEDQEAGRRYKVRGLPWSGWSPCCQLCFLIDRGNGCGGLMGTEPSCW